MNLVAVFCFAQLLIDCNVVCGASWDYSTGADGPSNWYKLKPTCAGPWQSPINIDPNKVVSMSNKGSMRILLESGKNLTSVEQYSVTNNGHSVEISFPPKTWRMQFGDDETNAFEVSQIHFHWGNDNTQGSEHTMCGRQYAIEAHMVCFAKNLYGTVGEAIGSPVGLSVLGILANVTTDISTDTLIDRMTGLEAALSKVIDSSAETKIDAFNLTKLVTIDEGRYFYRYPGSLTTPPCTTNVEWNLLKAIFTVTPCQIDLFRKIKWANGKSMVNNYRPVQSMDSTISFIPRIVYFHNKSIKLQSPTFFVTLVISLLFKFY